MGDIGFDQFQNEGVPINRLAVARAKGAMNLHRQANDLSRQRIRLLF
jgi:hypothetical protein